jgi:hypothetical protein
MDTIERSTAQVSSPELNDRVPWNEVGNEVTFRLKAITQHVKTVLSQEGLSDVEVEYQRTESNL